MFVSEHAPARANCAGAQDDGSPAFYQPFGNDGVGWNRRRSLMVAGNLC